MTPARIVDGWRRGSGAIAVLGIGLLVAAIVMPTGPEPEASAVT